MNLLLLLALAVPLSCLAGPSQYLPTWGACDFARNRVGRRCNMHCRRVGFTRAKR
jgi:hypothetical protein